MLQGQLCPVAMWLMLFPQLFSTNTTALQVAAGMLRATQMRVLPATTTTTTEVVLERRLRTGEDLNFVDDTSRNVYLVHLALAPSEICSRYGESATSPDLKTSIASRAFPLRCCDDDEVDHLGISLKQTVPKQLRGDREIPPTTQR